MESKKYIYVVIFCVLVEICRQMKGNLITFKVNECPQNQSKWDEAALRLNCSVDRHGKNTYHCVPNQDKTSLVEFCYNRLIGRFQEGYCLQLTKTLFLHSDNCLDILPGCPSESYLSNSIFKYPECQHINTESRCYFSDQACSKKLRDFGASTIISTTPFISKDLYPYKHDYIKVISITSGIFILAFVLIIAFIIKERIRILKQKPRMGIEAGEHDKLNCPNDIKYVDENIPFEDTTAGTNNKSTPLEKLKKSFKKGGSIKHKETWIANRFGGPIQIRATLPLGREDILNINNGEVRAIDSCRGEITIAVMNPTNLKNIWESRTVRAGENNLLITMNEETGQPRLKYATKQDIYQPERSPSSRARTFKPPCSCH